MLSKTTRWILILTVTVLVVMFALLILPVRASAAQVPQPVTNSCLTCHEDLYYLYDSGKLYCLTDHTDRCTNCHDGNAAVMKEEEAHVGLVVHPQEKDGEKCLECHSAQVTKERLAIFASEGGFDTVIKAEAYTPSTETTTDFPDIEKANPSFEKLSWLVGASVFFGFWLVLVLFSPLKP
jgi:hypothetical protein